MNYNALCIGVTVVVGFLFLLAWLGMSGAPHYTAGRPYSNPPGFRKDKTRITIVTQGKNRTIAFILDEHGEAVAKLTEDHRITAEMANALAEDYKARHPELFEEG